MGGISCHFVNTGFLSIGFLAFLSIALNCWEGSPAVAGWSVVHSAFTFLLLVAPR